MQWRKILHSSRVGGRDGKQGVRRAPAPKPFLLRLDLIGFGTQTDLVCNDVEATFFAHIHSTFHQYLAAFVDMRRRLPKFPEDDHRERS